jgi:glutamate formiminotransferase / 5-formyltetrahydrofolate cyclo-ligase
VAQFSLVRMTPQILLAVPNVSEGRDARVVAEIAKAFAGVLDEGANAAGGQAAGADASAERARRGVRLLDVHSDGDHHRAVFTLAGEPGELADAVLRGAAAAVERVDVMSRRPREDRPGQHPYVGAIDVAPVVYLHARDRGAACAEALVVADRIGAELGVPVFLYGELAGGDRKVTRAELRRGGVAGLAARMASTEQTGGVRPDFGPPRLHPTAGAALVAAREPMVAFNVQLSAPATVEDARAVAALVREGGQEGLAGVRAIGVALSGERVQVSMNVERPLEIPLATVLEAVGRHAKVTSAELVGLAPRAAFEGFPREMSLPGFDPAHQLIENALRS